MKQVVLYRWPIERRSYALCAQDEADRTNECMKKYLKGVEFDSFKSHTGENSFALPLLLNDQTSIASNSR